ncbi:MAG: aminoacyl-tRNA hydrolase [Bdellovibrionales bacterium]
MKLIVGLGNPGPKYQVTRHNIGFLFIDALVEVFEGKRGFKSEFKSETQKIKIGDEHVLLVKPQTFMNLSGEAVQPLMEFYKLETKDLLVVHDEVDQHFGVLKFAIKRGHGGHNGIRNIHQVLGTDDYARLRLGVGRPPVLVDNDGTPIGKTIDVADYVLQNFSKAEMAKIPDFMELAIQGVETWVPQGIGQASTQFNGKEVG